MIDISYDREKNVTKVELKDLKAIKNFLPLKVQFKNIITNKIDHEIELNEYTWATWCGAEFITDVLIYTSTGNLLCEYKWDVEVNGDEIEKILWFYLKLRQLNNIKSNGLVIGTHDGRTGHWIYPVKHNLSQATLVEGGDNQFIDLIENYKTYSNIKTINSVVTSKGENITWYHGGNGYSDSIKKESIEFNIGINYNEHHYLHIDNIVETNKSSLSINEIMNNENYDWLHLDVEGIDGELILSLEHKPNIIIYESMHIKEDMKKQLNLWFLENSYTTIEVTGDTIAIKK